MSVSTVVYSCGDLTERGLSTSDSFVVRGELENQDEVKRLSLNTAYLWSLGISIVIGGQFVGWNEALKAGFGSALIGTGLIGTAYCCLISCMAEISSAIPFGGGSYGIARVALGFFPGYMVAVMEATQNIVYVAQAAVSFGQIVTAITGVSSRYEILYGVFFYVTSLALQIAGGRTFWYMIMAMAVISVLLLLIYIFGTIPVFDFNKHALFDAKGEEEQWFRGGVLEFLRVLPFPCWFYVGVEAINLACKDVPNPRVQVPRGYLSCMATLFVLSFGVLFCCTSVSPGITQLMHEVDPLHFHFQTLFRTSTAGANAIILPSVYAMCSGFMYCYGKQLKAMAKSGLINPVFAAHYRNFRAPVNALILGSVCAFVIGNVELYVEALTTKHLFVLCMMCAFTVYASQFAAFIVFRYKFPTINREYHSPLGIAGAVYGCAVFTLAFVASVAFQGDYVAVSLYVCVVLIAVAYYFTVAQGRQLFSEEEKQVMFCAYLMKSNADRRIRLKKGPQAQRTGATLANPTSSKASTRECAAGKYENSSLRCRSTDARENSGISDVGPAAGSDLEGSGRSPSRRDSAASGGSRRLKLLVNTGSCRIVMTGEVNSEDLPTDAFLHDSQEHDDVMVMDDRREGNDLYYNQNRTDDVPAAEGEVITVSRSVLLSSADHVHYSKQNESSGQFTSGEGDLFV